jgi:hypothetical protein
VASTPFAPIEIEEPSMTISRTPSSRLDPAALPTDNGAAAQGAPSTSTGQASLPSAPPGLHARELSFSFGVAGGETAAMPPRRSSFPEIVEVPTSSTPEHDRGRMLRSGERSDSARGDVVPAGRGTRIHDFLGISSRRIASFVRGSAREEPSTPPSGRALAHAPTFGVQVAPPERNWRSVASAIAQGAGQVGTLALKELALTAQAVTPSMSALSGVARTMAPVAGHLIHQAVAVGLPTFAREMLAAGVMHGLRNAPPEVAFGLQGAVGTANLAMQVIREVRERRHPDEAARGFHSLSVAQWDSKTPAEQAAMRKHTQSVSRAITVGQIASSITNLSLMLQAHSEGPQNKAAMLRPLATELKVGLYTAMRDATQASFNMVAFDDKKDSTQGLAGNAFASARATYAGVMTAADVLSSQAMGLLVPGRGDAMAALVGTSNAMSPGDAWRTTAAAAGVSAVTNTLVEATDWFQRMHFQLSQNANPPPQVLKPSITTDDLDRVFDQAQSRAALINGLNSALSVLGLAMAKADVPSTLQGPLGSAGLGALVFLTDSPISGNWQAQKFVRAEVAEQEKQKKDGPVDLEAGLRAAGVATGAATGQSAEGSAEGSGRILGTVPGRKTPGQSFRKADVPAWPAPSRSGSNSPPDRSNTTSDDERRSGELVHRRPRTAAAPSQTVPPGSSSAT